MRIKDNVLVTVSDEDIINGTFVIPDGVTEIGRNAFLYNTNLKFIVIPNGVTGIGAYAFQNCKKLKSIHIPNSVTAIGDYAFSVCTSLNSINIPNSVRYIGKCAFYNCTNLIKKGQYKACEIIRDGDNITYSCGNTEYKIGEQLSIIDDAIIDDVECCSRDCEYYENLYDVFNYYHGDLNNIALFEVEPGDIIIKDEDERNSYRVTNTIKLVKRIPWSEALN